MTDNTQPEAREFTMSQYASKDDMIGAMRKRIAELESELEAVGAGGVQALSAAPAVPTSVKGAMWFTKKPVTIQAIQWTGENLREVITFTDGPPDTRSHHAGMAWDAYRDLVARDGLKIYTLEGKMLASPGDWIIRGVKGEMYPCKDEIFRLTYEPVGEVVSASCDHATVRWLHQTSSVGGGDPRNSRAWPKVSGVSRDEGHSRALLVFFAAEPTDDEMRAVHDTLAASPTPPAEQQAAPKAAPVVWLSSKQLRGVTALHGQYLPFRCQPEGWFDTPVYLEQAAPKAAPGDVLDEALRERDDAEDFIDALLDEVLGHERPEWSSSYGHADALNDVQERMTALHKPAVDKAWGRFQSAMAAPQQEAQVPALFVSAKQLASLADPSHATAGSYLPARKTRAGLFTMALYTAPQPAPAPLSDEQIKELIEDGVFLGNCKEIVRAIELAHGITQKGGSNGL